VTKRSNRRGRNEGAIYQTANGQWRGYVPVEEYSLSQGRQRRKYFRGRTRAAVARKVARALAGMQQGLPQGSISERMTVGRWLLHWLESRRESVKPRTYEQYSLAVNKHFIPAFGKRRLTKLTAEDIEGYLVEKRATGNLRFPGTGLSKRSIQIQVTVLRMALKEAEKRGHVPRNVAMLVAKPSAKEIEPTKARVFLEADQSRLLLKHAKASKYYRLYVLALYLGMRKGEALGVHWKAVDLEQGTLKVEAVLRLVGKLEIDTPKSGHSRQLVLPHPALRALTDEKDLQEMRRRRAGSEWEEWGLVFTRPTGRPLNQRDVSKDFKRVLKAAGLPDMRFHDLRHSCASLLHGEGVSDRVIMEILGHSNITVTMNTYTHVASKLQRDAAKRMEAAIGS